MGDITQLEPAWRIYRQENVVLIKRTRKGKRKAEREKKIAPS
jgi:hypothetical protein